MSFAQIVEIVKRRKTTLVLSVILALIPILLYNRYATPIYQAAAIVAFEDYSKDTVMGIDFAGSFFRGNFVANRIEEMKTKNFARQVYEELPDSARRQFPFPDPLPPRFNREAYLVNQIRASLSVQSVKTTDLVTVSFTSENPELTKTVANTVIAVLQKSNLRVRRQELSSVREFIDEQIRVVRDRLQQAEDTLRDFKAHENITSLENESREILQRITQAEVIYNQVRTEKGAKQRRLAVIQKKLDEQKQDLASAVTQINSPLTVKLKEKLVELQVRYSNLQVQNYPENHPKMVELKEEIDQAKQNLIQTTMKILEGEKLKGVLDPISQLQKYLEESILLEVELQALGAQEAHLQKILDGYSEYLKTLPDKELHLVRLMRDQEVNNKIYLRLLDEREEARIREASEIGNIRVMEPAETPRAPYRPRKLLNLMVGLFTGTVVGFFLIFVREFLREAPRTQEELEQILKLPVLASVPQAKPGMAFSLNGRYHHYALLDNEVASPFIRDAYAYLWSSLQFSDQRSGQVVMITSAGPGEGKSTLAANLSITATRHGKRTILIDGDLRKPILHEIFGVPISPGLTNLVAEANQAWPYTAEYEAVASAEKRAEDSSEKTVTKWKRLSIREAIVSFIGNVLQITSTTNLRILTKGDPIMDPDVLWASPMIDEVLKILKQTADFIVIDTPPVIGIPDAGLIALHSDGIVLCVEAEQTERKMLLRTQKILDHASSKFWGAVLNKVDPTSLYGSYKYYKYYKKHYNKSHIRGRSQA